MKKKIISFIKVLSVIVLLVTIIITAAYLWPTSKFKPPKYFEKTIINNVNIIDVETGNIAYNQYVLIENSRITKIDTVQITAFDDALIIDGTGKYLIPGLWDMHTHSNQHSEWLHHPLYIANGVTSVRDMSGQLNEKDSYWVVPEWSPTIFQFFITLCSMNCNFFDRI